MADSTDLKPTRIRAPRCFRVVVCACVSPETCALGMADDDAVIDTENCDMSNIYRFEVDVAQGRLIEARRCACFLLQSPFSLFVCRRSSVSSSSLPPTQ